MWRRRLERPRRGPTPAEKKRREEEEDAAAWRSPAARVRGSPAMSEGGKAHTSGTNGTGSCCVRMLLRDDGGRAERRWRCEQDAAQQGNGSGEVTEQKQTLTRGICAIKNWPRDLRSELLLEFSNSLRWNYWILT
jgi:hypothetical protein